MDTTVELRLVKLVWLDACASVGWGNYPTPSHCVTVGWLVEEEETHYVIASTMGNDPVEYNASMAIPKGMVVSLEDM